MANGYMPRADAAAVQFMCRFVDALRERPAVYRVSSDELAALEQAVGQFVQAFSVASNPVTRTKPAITTKDERRLSAELACRPIYLRIKVDPEISDADKIAAAIRPVNASRRRTAPPSEKPSIQLQSLTTSSHVLVWMGGAKPRGAVGLQLFRSLSQDDDETPVAPEYLGTYSRNPIHISYHREDNRKLATYIARWIDRRGRTGPWSNRVQAVVTAMCLWLDQSDESAAA